MTGERVNEMTRANEWKELNELVDANLKHPPNRP